MRRLPTILIIIFLAASPALAKSCGVFTNEGRLPGEVVADMTEPGFLTIRHKWLTPYRYRLQSSGTGLSAQQGTP